MLYVIWISINSRSSMIVAVMQPEMSYYGSSVQLCNPWHGGIPFFIPLRRLDDSDEGQPNLVRFTEYTVDPKIWPARLAAAEAGADEEAKKEAALLRDLQGDANESAERRAAVAEVAKAE